MFLKTLKYISGQLPLRVITVSLSFGIGKKQRYLFLIAALTAVARKMVPSSDDRMALSQLVPDDLAILPKIWLREFQQAIIEGKVKEIETLVKEIPSQNKKLAATLLDFVARYEFEYLLELIEKTGNLN